ncbi:MAG: tetratricopeptide repeat protein [Syntrophales bacterium]|nr:tetratricopeptide repeat protein [Syntrophales bacterium]
MALLDRNTMRVNSAIILLIAGFLSFFCILISEVWANPLEEQFYGIHVASFRDAGRAEAQVRMLEEAGCAAFSRAFSLPGQDEWQRVFAGYHGNREDAFDRGEMLRKQGVIERFSVMPFQGLRKDLPEQELYGIHVASFRDAGRAEAQVRMLEEAGHQAFSRTFLQPGQGEWHRVFAGLHNHREMALERGEVLKKEGVVENYSIIVLDEIHGETATEPRQARHLKTLPEKEASKPDTILETAKESTVAPPMDAVPAEPLKTVISKREKKPVDAPEPILTEGGPVTEDATVIEEIPTTENGSDTEKGAVTLSSISIQKPVDDTATKIAEIPEAQHAGLTLISSALAYSPMEQNPAVAEAMDHIRSENYEAALKAFQSIQGGGVSGEAMRDFLSRRIADCIFMLSMRGSRSQVMAAIEGYRQLLRVHPESAEGNDEIRIMMAEGYNYLRMYHEGLRELNRVFELHPRSPNLSQALYMRALFHYRMQRYEAAIDELGGYLKRFPGGAHQRSALFFLGDSHSQLGDFDEADEAFGKSLTMWPSIESLPRQELIVLGSHYMRSGSPQKALEIFLAWFNLYSDEPEAPEVLYGAARILAAMEQVPAALGLLGKVIERFPETKQAQESMIVMADMGLRRSGRALPRHIFDDMEYYLDPIFAYDEVLEKDIDRGRRDELLFLKVGALMKLERYPEAFETAHRLHLESPWGSYRRENMLNLSEIAVLLINRYHDSGDHLAAVNTFLLSRRHGITEEGDYDSLFKAAKSLENVGLSAVSRSVLENLASRFRDERRRGRAMLALAELDLREGLYESAEKRAGEVLAKASLHAKSLAPGAQELLGDIAFGRKDYGAAERHYATLAAAALFPEARARASCKYGDTLMALGRYSQALTQYEKALDAVEKNGLPDNGDIAVRSYKGIAESQYRLGQYGESAFFYGLVLKKVPDEGAESWSFYRMGQSYAKLSERDRALQNFESMKENADDPFWHRVADYARNYEMFRGGLGRAAEEGR